MKCLVTLGYFDDSGEGALAEIDLERGTHRTLLAYRPPEPLRVPAKGFTGAAWSGAPGRSPLLVCGHAAVFRIEPARPEGGQPEDPAAWRVDAIWHLPCMNDLHHVAVAGDRAYVVNTGLESIDVYSMDGCFQGSHALHPGWLSAARQAGLMPSRDEWPALRDARWPPARPSPPSEASAPDPYYTPPAVAAEPFHRRKARDYIHPNHIAIAGSQRLVTRFLDCSVDDIVDWRRVIADTPGLPHDGVLDDDRFWLTCVNGLVVAYAVERGRVTGREVERHDVFATGHAGWCRGLAVTPEHLIVGLSEIRRMPRYRWCDRPFAGTETAVLALDRRTGRLAARVDLGDAVRHSKLFTILPL